MKMHDFGNKIVAHVVDEETLLPIPLNDKEVILIIRLDGEITQKSMTITDEANGIAEYQIEDGLLDSYGEAELEIRVEGTGLGVTSQDETLRVDNTNYSPPEEP